MGGRGGEGRGLRVLPQRSAPAGRQPASPPARTRRASAGSAGPAPRPWLFKAPAAAHWPSPLPVTVALLWRPPLLGDGPAPAPPPAASAGLQLPRGQQPPPLGGRRRAPAAVTRSLRRGQPARLAASALCSKGWAAATRNAGKRTLPRSPAQAPAPTRARDKSCTQRHHPSDGS